MSSQKNSFFKNQINGMDMKIFLAISVVIWAIAFTGNLPTDVFALFIFLWSVGLFLNFVGKNIPFLGKYIGFGPILALFGSSLLVSVGLVDKALKEQVNMFVTDSILPILIGLLLAGSILGNLDRETLKKAAIRYIPVIFIGQICAILGCFIVGKALGYNLFDSIVLTAFPTFSGGSSGAMAAIPATISAAFGIDGNQFIGYMMAALTISNIEAILISGLLNFLGKKKPSLTGNGVLVRNNNKMMNNEEEKSKKFDGNFMNMFRCLLIIGFLVILGNVISIFMMPIINLNYLVYTIILCVIVKLTGILPKDWEASMGHWFEFALPLFLPALMAGIGIGSIDLVSTFSSITPTFLLLVTVTVLCFVIGTMVSGYIFGFYPIESGIAAGCCSVSIGGTGGLVCCEVSNRMNLYPFATLSTRVGGSMALLILGILLQFIKI